MASTLNIPASYSDALSAEHSARLIETLRTATRDDMKMMILNLATQAAGKSDVLQNRMIEAQANYDTACADLNTSMVDVHTLNRERLVASGKSTAAYEALLDIVYIQLMKD